MTTDAALVRDSYTHVKPVADAAGMLLCERLLAVSPDLRKLFGDNLAERRGALMAGIEVVISHLNDPAGLATILARFSGWLARRGVSDAHYDRFGEALVWTMSHALGHRFTPEVKKAWRTVFEQIAGQMRRQTRAAA
jgi:nitric oxide dioxygenase